MRGYCSPYRARDCKPYWDDWGTYNLSVTLLSFVVMLEYSYGKKIVNIIKPYML